MQAVERLTELRSVARNSPPPPLNAKPERITFPARIFGAALVWWRFYTFYLFILLGALAAGGTVLRALRDDDVTEQETEEDAARATA